MTYFTGLYLLTRSFTATTLDVDGSVIAPARMPCVPRALKAYFAKPPGEHVATVECATGWYWVSDFRGTEVELRLAQAKDFDVDSLEKVKTDGGSPNEGVACQRFADERRTDLETRCQSLQRMSARSRGERRRRLPLPRPKRPS